VALAARAAEGHGAGERYDLPLPLVYFVAGAALTVALSFVAAAVATRAAPRAASSAGLVLPLGPLGLLLRGAARLVGLALFVLVIAAGLLGDPHPMKNLAPTLVWIIWWVGLSLVVAGIGNVWPALDPWRTLFDGADALARRRRGGRGLALGWPYPARAGVWPAAALLLLFVWLEVIFPDASVPARIAGLALAWTAVTLAGMVGFGADTWQRNADVFAVYFATLGRFAPLAAGPDGRSLLLRPPARGLVTRMPVPPGMAAFVIAMLATVLFDGLLGTRAWRALDHALSGGLARVADREGYLLASAGLLAVWLVFLGAYLATAGLTARLAGAGSAAAAARLLAPSLVPIATAYNVAHNLSYLLLQGQELIPLLSDPLGRGWNLLGTATWSPDVTLVGSRFAWYAAVGAIITGHAISVWVAHRVALREWNPPRVAVRASLPLTALMVVYTALSLWVIADPLVRFREPDPSYSRPSLSARASAPTLLYSWVTSMETSPSSSMPSVIRLGRQQTVQSSVKVWRRPAVESTVSSFSSPQNAHPYVTFRILRANVS
jgi:hypothetical protein